MNSLRLTILAFLLPIFFLNVAVADTHENHFASVFVGKKKIGQVHYMATHNEAGVLQELKTHSSYSILGVEIYHHTLDVHEFWKDEEIQTLSVTSNDDGDVYDADIRREAGGYIGTLNNEAIALPLEAFPVAVWHYAIADNPILFNLPDFEIYRVKVVKSTDSVTIGGQNIAAEKFVFSGDWEATVWFDHKQRFLKWTYKVIGIKVVVLLDSLPS